MAAQGGSGNQQGGAGTILTKASNPAYGDLLVENGGNGGATTWVSDTYSFDRIEAHSNGYLTLHGADHTIGGLVVGNGGVVYLYSATEAAWCQVDAGGTLVASGGRLFDLTILGDTSVSGTIRPGTANSVTSFEAA